MVQRYVNAIHDNECIAAGAGSAEYGGAVVFASEVAFHFLYGHGFGSFKRNIIVLSNDVAYACAYLHVVVGFG